MVSAAARTQAERQNYELIGDGEGIHWPELDEDISVEGLFAGDGPSNRPLRSQSG